MRRRKHKDMAIATAPPLLEGICTRRTVCVRKLRDNRTERAKLHRFLINKKATVPRMLACQRARIAEHVSGRHILAIQDTSEINYEAHSERGTRPPFAHLKGTPQMSEGLSPHGGRHHFFEATSLSMALLSIASANSFLSLVFSSSSAFRRLASEASRRPRTSICRRSRC
jgi:hypothetical protein